MKEYTIDLNKWICGGGGDLPQRLGRGELQMLNTDGYMCCLGQFAVQAGVHEDDLQEPDPEDVGRGLDSLYDSHFVFISEDGLIKNTTLTQRCIEINDDSHTDIWTKLNLLARELAKKDITLLVTGDLMGTEK